MINFKKTTLAIALEQRLNLNFTPRRATDKSNGFDLFACIPEGITIFPDEVGKVCTGVHIWIGSWKETFIKNGGVAAWAGLLIPRSSSKGLILNNTVGLIDNDYQGEIICKYRNITNESVHIKSGECFAQLVIVPTYIGILEEIEEFETITNRGEGGFGSTNLL
jgi:dUTP pyrophosphatase